MGHIRALDTVERRRTQSGASAARYGLSPKSRVILLQFLSPELNFPVDIMVRPTGL